MSNELSSRRSTAVVVVAFLVLIGGLGALWASRSADAAPPGDGPAGETPGAAYVEDPLDENGVPIPVGPQHDAHAVYGTIPAPTPAGPPAPVATPEDMAKFDNPLGG